MRIQDLASNPMQLNQDVAFAGPGLNTQISNWFVASESLGKVAVGKNMLAAKSAAMFTDLSGTQVIANYVLFDGGAFFLRQDGALLANKLTWGAFGYCYSQQRPWGGDCDGIVMEGVRYDSPTFAGFSVARYFTGARTDGSHFAAGADWGASSLIPVSSAALTSAPVSLSAAIGVMGTRIFEVDVAPGVAAVDITLGGTAPALSRTSGLRLPARASCRCARRLAERAETRGDGGWGLQHDCWRPRSSPPKGPS